MSSKATFFNKLRAVTIESDRPGKPVRRSQITIAVAYRAGWNASERGVSRTMCFYAVPEKVAAWERGWDDARERKRSLNG
jgi:ribosome modulation factor